MGRIWKTAATAALAFIMAAMFTAPSAYSQKIEKKKVKGAYGEWSMSPDMTGGEIMSRARHEAKEDALRKAGVGENVWSIFGMMSSSVNNTFMEAYSEMSVMAIEGKVAVSKEQSKWYLNKEGNPVYTVRLNADVTIDHTEEDLTYAISTKGIGNSYNNGDQFKCTFTVDGTDSYLKVFFFNSEMSGVLYPSTPEQKMQLFKVGETYSFPVLKDGQQGSIQLDKNGEAPESLVFLFVATKKNYPYIGDGDAASILQWVYSLPVNERALELKQCTIF